MGMFHLKTSSLLTGLELTKKLTVLTCFISLWPVEYFGDNLIIIHILLAAVSLVVSCRWSSCLCLFLRLLF